MLVVGVEQGDGEVVLGESWPGENRGKEDRYQERRPAEAIGKDRKSLSFDSRLTRCWRPFGPQSGLARVQQLLELEGAADW
jgi:hypothetical protein